MYVLNFALKMEKLGKEYWEKLANATTVTGIRNIFMKLAEEQQELHDTFAAMKDKVGGPLLANSAMLDRARNIFTRIFSEDLSPVRTLRNDLDAYSHALEVKARIVHFFEVMARKEEDEEAKALLLEIVDEEKRHYSEIENICEFVAVPKRFLTATEFGRHNELM